MRGERRTTVSHHHPPPARGRVYRVRGTTTHGPFFLVRALNALLIHPPCALAGWLARQAPPPRPRSASPPLPAYLERGAGRAAAGARHSDPLLRAQHRPAANDSWEALYVTTGSTTKLFKFQDPFLFIGQELLASVDYQPDSQLSARIRAQMGQESAADAIPGLMVSVGVSG